MEPTTCLAIIPYQPPEVFQDELRAQCDPPPPNIPLAALANHFLFGLPQAAARLGRSLVRRVQLLHPARVVRRLAEDTLHRNPIQLREGHQSLRHAVSKPSLSLEEIAQHATFLDHCLANQTDLFGQCLEEEDIEVITDMKGQFDQWIQCLTQSRSDHLSLVTPLQIDPVPLISPRQILQEFMKHFNSLIDKTAPYGVVTRMSYRAQDELGISSSTRILSLDSGDALPSEHPSSFDDKAVRFIEGFARLPLIGNPFFQFGKSQVCSFLQHLKEQLERNNDPKSALVQEQITAIENMQIFSQQTLKNLLSTLRDLNVCIDGFLRIPHDVVKAPQEENSKRFLLMVERLSRSHHPCTLSEDLRTCQESIGLLSEEALLSSLFLSGSHRECDPDLGDKIDLQYEALCEAMHSEKDQDARFNALQLLISLHMTPAFYKPDFIDQISQAESERRFEIEAQAQKDIGVRLRTLETQFLSTFSQYLTYQIAQWIAGHPFEESFTMMQQVSMKDEENRDRNFYARLVTYIEGQPINNLKKQCIQILCAPIPPFIPEILPQIIKWTLRFYQNRIASLLTRTVTKEGLIPHLAEFFATMSEAQTVRSITENTAPYDQQVKEHLVRLQNQAQIQQRVERFVVKELLPLLDLPSGIDILIERVDKAIGNTLSEKILGNILCITLYTTKYVFVVPTNYLLNFVLRFSLRQIIHRKQYIPFLFNMLTKAVENNVITINQGMQSIAKLVEASARMLRQERVPATASNLEIQKEPSQSNLRPFNELVRNFLVSLKNFHSIQDRHQLRTYLASQDRGEEHPQPLPTNPMTGEILSFLAEKFPHYVKTFQSSISAMLHRAWEYQTKDPDTFSQILLEQLYRAAQDLFSPAQQIEEPHSYRSSTEKPSPAQIRRMLMKDLQSVLVELPHRIFKETEFRKQTDINNFIHWLIKEFGHEGNSIDFLSKKTDELFEESPRTSIKDHEKHLICLIELCNFLHSKIKELSQKFQLTIADLQPNHQQTLTNYKKLIDSYLLNILTPLQSQRNRLLIYLEQSKWADFNAKDSVTQTCYTTDTQMRSLFREIKKERTLHRPTILNQLNTLYEDLKELRIKIMSFNDQLFSVHGNERSESFSQIIEQLQAEIHSMQVSLDHLQCYYRIRALKQLLVSTGPESQLTLILTEKESQPTENKRTYFWSALKAIEKELVYVSPLNQCDLLQEIRKKLIAHMNALGKGSYSERSDLQSVQTITNFLDQEESNMQKPCEVLGYHPTSRRATSLAYDTPTQRIVKLTRKYTSPHLTFATPSQGLFSVEQRRIGRMESAQPPDLMADNDLKRIIKEFATSINAQTLPIPSIHETLVKYFLSSNGAPSAIVGEFLVPAEGALEFLLSSPFLDGLLQSLADFIVRD